MTHWWQFSVDPPRRGTSSYVAKGYWGTKHPLEGGGYELRAEIKVDGDRPVIVGVSVTRWPDLRKGLRPLSLRDFRRLPIATFMEAAREAVAAYREHERGRPLKAGEFDSRVRRARPPRVKSGTKTREWWAQLAAAYQDEVRRGTPNPGAALAKRMGEDPAKVRVWVSRMRHDKGLLPDHEKKGER